jgi:hypothetical protein
MNFERLNLNWVAFSINFIELEDEVIIYKSDNFILTLFFWFTLKHLKHPVCDDKTADDI